jgi:tRNA(Met) C34 N-acetyltransferase TmcA
MKQIYNMDMKMQAIYHAEMNELTFSFIENLKKQFQNSKVEIVIKDMDETDYLNKSAKNKQYLDEAIQEVNSKNFISKAPEELGL